VFKVRNVTDSFKVKRTAKPQNDCKYVTGEGEAIYTTENIQNLSGDRDSAPNPGRGAYSDAQNP